MPELDGLAATAQIRELEVESGRHIPIIAITAHAMKGDRQRCLDAGMDDYVSKPFKPKELFATIERLGRSDPGQADERPAHGLSSSGSLIVADPAPEQDPAIGVARPDAAAVFDYDIALENVGGSKAVLVEMVELFAAECPKQMAAVEEAYSSGDKEAVMRAAHTLKGSVALFAADDATRVAKRIEFMGRDGDLGDFATAWDELNRHIDKLSRALGCIGA